MFDLYFEFAIKAKLAKLRERMEKGYTLEEADKEISDKQMLIKLEADAINLGLE